MVMFRDTAVGNYPVNTADFTDHTKTFAAELAGIRDDRNLLRHLTHHLVKVRFPGCGVVIPASRQNPSTPKKAYQTDTV